MSGRGAFELRDPASKRMDVAIQLLNDGRGFHYCNVAFSRSDDILWCHALSPWRSGPGLHEDQAARLVESARAVLSELTIVSPGFAQAISKLTPALGIINYDDWGSFVIAVEVDGHLDWQAFEPPHATP